MRLPDDTQRHAIVGATGSGKTQAAVWHLSHRNFHLMPWVVYNFKGDSAIDSIPYAHDIGIEEIPTQPGVYIARPLPSDESALEAHMWSIWERGNIGVYVDEGYMVGRNNRAFRALLTQGRSKRIPMMVLSQRPVWMDRFIFSESEFFQVFRLQHRKDVQAVEQFVPAENAGANLGKRLPPYHSWYYDVQDDKLAIVKPVPELPVILSTFERRLSAIVRNQKKAI